MMVGARGGFGHTLVPTDKRLHKSCAEDKGPRNCLLVWNLLFCLVTARAGIGPIPCRDCQDLCQTLQGTQSSVQHQIHCREEKEQNYPPLERLLGSSSVTDTWLLPRID